MTIEKSILTNLLTVQKELSKHRLKVDSKNTYHNNTYVSLNAVLDLVLPALHKHDILLTQWVTHYEGHPALCTKLSKGGDEVSDTMLLMLKAEDPQAQGSAITYARRYALMSILGLVGRDEDDDGQKATDSSQAGNSFPASNNTTSNDRPASDAQRKLMLTTIGRKGFAREQAQTILMGIAGTDSVDAVTMKQASTLIDKLFKASQEDLSQYLLKGDTSEVDRGQLPDDIPPPEDIEIIEESDN